MISEIVIEATQTTIVVKATLEGKKLAARLAYLYDGCCSVIDDDFVACITDEYVLDLQGLIRDYGGA